MNMNKYWLYVTFGIATILLFGIAIPKLTVRDSVALTDAEKRCVQAGVKQQLDNPFQRVALVLGKSAVIEKKQNSLTVKSYTVFRIPLPFTHLFNRLTTDVICDWATNEYNSEQLGISLNYPIDYVLSEGNGEGSAADAYFIGLTPRPSSTPELPPSTQVDLEPSHGILLGFYREADQADSFDEWVREQMISRAGPDNVQEPLFHPTTVGGVSAVRYLDASGLYQRDTVLLKHGAWVVQIAADDTMYFKADLDSILSSITFH